MKNPETDKTQEGEVTLPVVQEELQVGKREVDRGGVRVQTHVTERPVEATVQLREEKVTVDRHAVDRPVDARDRGAFQEGSFEVRQSAEEAVVSKEARVVEEVLVSKRMTERTETVRDTVKRTDVEVERLGGAGGTAGYGQFEADFRQHAGQGGTYDQLAPAYRHGYSLASDDSYRGKGWDTVETDAKAHWEKESPGTWDRIKDSVRYAWERVQAAVS